MFSERVCKVVCGLQFTVVTINRQIIPLAKREGVSISASFEIDGGLARAVCVPYAGFTLDAHSNFIHLAAQYRVQSKGAADTLVDKIFGLAEARNHLVLAEATRKSARMVSSAIAADAEVIGRAELIIVVP